MEKINKRGKMFFGWENCFEISTHLSTSFIDTTINLDLSLRFLFHEKVEVGNGVKEKCKFKGGEC